MRHPQFLTWGQFKRWKTSVLTNAALAGPDEHRYALGQVMGVKRKVKLRLTCEGVGG